jgi:hypothetical protein
MSNLLFVACPIPSSHLQRAYRAPLSGRLERRSAADAWWADSLNIASPPTCVKQNPGKCEFRNSGQSLPTATTPLPQRPPEGFGIGEQQVEAIPADGGWSLVWPATWPEPMADSSAGWPQRWQGSTAGWGWGCPCPRLWPQRDGDSRSVGQGPASATATDPAGHRSKADERAGEEISVSQHIRKIIPDSLLRH